jgi:OOP family OmpA-OmpF porin
MSTRKHADLIRNALLLIVFVVFPQPLVLAEEKLSENFHLAPYGTYLHTGGDRTALDGWGGGLGLGKTLSSHWDWEIRGFWQHYSRDNTIGGQLDLVGGSLDLQYFFQRSRFSPYLVTSLGGMTNSGRIPGHADSASSFIFEIGAGLGYELCKTIQLRGDVRYRLDTLPSSLDHPLGVLNDGVVNLGLVWQSGG